MSAVREMRVHKYIPEGLYGFAVDKDGQVFFHLGVFDPGESAARPPHCIACNQSGCTWGLNAPPVLGELVQVTLAATQSEGEGQAPRAERVQRVSSPRQLGGTVDSFDAARGFGWAVTSEGESFHLHRSEIVDGRVPLVGQRVVFYAGERLGKPRACHVKVCG